MRKLSFYYVSINLILAIVISTQSQAQDISNFVQFYINPALINPALTGADGKAALYLTYKKQWAGIEGAPSIANASLQVATPKMVNLGLNITNDKQGLLSTSSLLFTGGYTISLQNNAMVRFGFSLGAGWNKVDMASLNFGSVSGNSDPILADLLDSNFQLLGNAGLSFHTNTFHIGLSLPTIIQPTYLTKDAFSVQKVNPLESALIHTSYRLYFNNDQHVFEPYLIYRFNQSLPSQLEVAGILHLMHKVWVGGSYKQDFGISGIAGFKPNNQLAVGYAYTLKNTGLNELNRPSHEISVALLFGERGKKVPYYSFVDTAKPGKHAPVSKAVAARQRQKAKALAAKKKKATVAKASPPKPKPEPKVEPTKPAVVETPKEVVVEKPAVDPPRPTGPAHDGGPRTKNQQLFFIEDQVQHEEEQEKLSRLEIHKDNATDHHGEDFHPHADRHEFVKRGDHSAEMDYADYVIVGAFKSEENAKHFSDGLRKLGFTTSDYGFISERQIWYVHISESNDINKAKADRDTYRKMNMFKDAWLLTVHE